MTTPRQPTNIIWVFGDQHRAQALGCNLDPNAVTPHIDLLAAHGLHFENAVCGVPLCCPFRGSLLTGLYPHQAVPGHEYPLDPDQPTIAHTFREHGYHTAYFGKWHLDGFHESSGRAAMHVVAPHRRGGFQQWLGYENNNSQWDTYVHGTDLPQPERLDGYETDALTDHLLGYLKKRETDGKPFFTVLSVQPPHDPYVAPPQYMRRHLPADIELRGNVPAIPAVQEQARRDLAGYYAQIENLDANLGRIMQQVNAGPLAENTRILFFSDHGDMHGSQGQFRKTTPYEEALRIPFIIGPLGRYYEAGHSGRRPALINHVDIAPTTLGLCGIRPPVTMAGHDYSGLTRGETRPQPDSAFIQSVIPTGHEHSCDKAWRGLVTTDGWKYVCFEQHSWLLFNLNEDPLEQRNLAHDSLYAKIRQKLQARLQQWIDATDDRFTVPKH